MENQLQHRVALARLLFSFDRSLAFLLVACSLARPGESQLARRDSVVAEAPLQPEVQAPIEIVAGTRDCYVVLPVS